MTLQFFTQDFKYAMEEMKYQREKERMERQKPGSYMLSHSMFGIFLGIQSLISCQDASPARDCKMESFGPRAPALRWDFGT